MVNHRLFNNLLCVCPWNQWQYWWCCQFVLSFFLLQFHAWTWILLCSFVANILYLLCFCMRSSVNLFVASFWLKYEISFCCTSRQMYSNALMQTLFYFVKLTCRKKVSFCWPTVYRTSFNACCIKVFDFYTSVYTAYIVYHACCNLKFVWHEDHYFVHFETCMFGR